MVLRSGKHGHAARGSVDNEPDTEEQSAMKILKITRWDLVLLCGFILAIAGVAQAQYKGEPVKKDRLINVLRSRQFQTRDIVQVINESGVEFRMSPAIESELIGAGARPAVLDAVRRNFRGETVRQRVLAGQRRAAKPTTR